MEIRYVAPLKRGYESMKKVLFRPFDLGKWLTIGFGCWLAQIIHSGGGGASYDFEPERLSDWSRISLPDFGRIYEEPLVFGCAMLIVAAVVLVLVLIPLLLWLSSRGHFVFLDNVVRDRAELKEPWRRFRAPGNSLFLWRVGFWLAAAALLLTAASPLLFYFFQIHRGPIEDFQPAAVAILGLLPVIVVGTVLAYAQRFLTDFVVPIMAFENLRTNDAWRRFLPLFKRHVGAFLLYGLFVLGLWITVAFAGLVLVVASCCILAVPLIIPYVGTVFLLPVYVTFRAFSVEFLRQFLPGLGPDDVEPAAAALAA